MSLGSKYFTIDIKINSMIFTSIYKNQIDIHSLAGSSGNILAFDKNLLVASGYVQ